MHDKSYSNGKNVVAQWCWYIYDFKGRGGANKAPTNQFDRVFDQRKLARFASIKKRDST